MQVTVDIPEPLYRELEHRAQVSHCSVEQVLLERAFGTSSGESRTPERFPNFIPIKAGKGGTVDLNRNLNDAFFEDFDPA